MQEGQVPDVRNSVGQADICSLFAFRRKLYSVSPEEAKVQDTAFLNAWWRVTEFIALAI